MTKKVETKAATSLASPVFAFGKDENGKPHGARFSQALTDDLINATLRMNCRVIQNHSAALTALGMKLPAGRIYASGKAFIPNIRRDLYDKLEAARQLPPEVVEGLTPVHLFGEPSTAGGSTDNANAVSMTPGLPKTWDAIAAGSLVLVLDEPFEGYWEAIVIGREEEIVTLRYRDYPKVPAFQRNIATIALLNPGPA
jgi:hypothetical protein